MSQIFSPSEIDDFRRLFPVTRNWCYLNHAGVAPISARVGEAIAAATRDAMEHGYTLGAKWHQQMEAVRIRAADFMGAAAGEIAFVKNTSHGLSLVARGLDWQSGDEVILSDAEFPTNIYPWMALEKRGVAIKKIPERGFELQLGELGKLATPKTRLISLSSAQYGSGFRLPIAEIGEFCRERNILFFLDAIQTLGAFPLDVVREQVDFLSADAHKWLLGQEGIGLLYVRKELIKDIEPTLLGWNSVVDSFSFDRLHFELPNTARRFEEGTANSIAILGLGAAIDLLAEVGVDRVSRRILELTDYLIDGLKKLDWEITSSLHPKYRSGIVTFRPKGAKLEILAVLERELFAKKIYISLRRGSLRASPHFYNTEAEMDSLLRELSQLKS